MKRNERGMVTAELAIASLVLVAVAAGMIGVFGVVVAQVRCIDAAAEIARQTSRVTSPPWSGSPGTLHPTAA